MTEVFSIPVRVYIEDTDAGGIVFHSNYLNYMERARTEFFRKLGYAKPAFVEEDKLFVVAESNVKYLKPARLDDQLMASAQVTLRKRTYIVFEQLIGKDDEILCKAEIKVACVDTKNLRPAMIPVDIIEAIEGYL